MPAHDAIRDAAAEQAETDVFFMQEALRLAENAAAMGEVPVGAVVV